VPAKKPKVVQVAAVGSSGGSGARLVALDEYGEIWVTRVQGLPTPNWSGFSHRATNNEPEQSAFRFEAR
jgi:hypothetical protein